MKKIRVLVVDDSLVFRETLARGLSVDPMIEVVATAVDPFDARDKILEYKPDVMTLDIEMPRMNGIEFLRKLMPQYPMPTIVISAVNEHVFEAINLGAIDFVRKPDGHLFVANKEFFAELVFKVKIAANAKIQKIGGKGHAHTEQVTSQNISSKIIAIGASTGGTIALTNVLTALEPPLPGIVIVQHIPPVFSEMFARRLDSITTFDVKEAVDGDSVTPGKVLIAAGNQHMRVKKIGTQIKVECFAGEKVNGHCPSVDVLFNSVVNFGANAVGVIMTGMGYDGAKGLLNMRKAGAKTIGQDEKSSVVYGMPKVAYNIGAVEYQVSLEQIPDKICSLISNLK
jgi:two-component system chemotaxis response regulator CheB